MWYSNTVHNSVLIFALMDWLRVTYRLNNGDLSRILGKLKDCTQQGENVFTLYSDFFELASINSIEFNFTQQTIKIRWDLICTKIISKP